MNISFSEDHYPVMLSEILSYIEAYVKSSSLPVNILDGTFGAGGYTSNILKNTPTNINVLSLDRDLLTTEYSNKIKAVYSNRFKFFIEKYSNFDTILKNNQIEKLDVAILDLGLSSMQIKDRNRGFSFKENTALNMEMGLNKVSAENFINKASEALIADVLYYYGEEYEARRIARSIIYNRKKQPIITTFDLANIIRKAKTKKQSKIDAATKSFQAIRIYINDELNELNNFLQKIITYMKKEGLIIIISFHSLEDRIVKRFFNESLNIQPTTKKPITPSNKEIIENRASTSAKMRVGKVI